MMKSISLTVLGIMVFLMLIGNNTAIEPLPTPVSAEEIAEVIPEESAEVVEEPLKEDKPEVTWRDNPSNCDLDGDEVVWPEEGPEFPCHKRKSPAPSATQPSAPTQKSGAASVTLTGSKQQWLAASNIPQSDWGYADSILGQESTWNPAAVNSIGCIGLGQACPKGNKSELLAKCPNWRTDPVCQLNVWHGYALRYGSWKQAHSFKWCKYTCYSTRTNSTVYKNGEPWW